MGRTDGHPGRPAGDDGPRDRPPGWEPDPTGHYEFRWWDGRSWTNRVAGEGVPTHDRGFDALPPAQRGWGGADIAAYADRERFAATFGEVTMPTQGLRRWEVEGEGRHQEALDRVAGPKARDGVWVERVATLRPSPPASTLGEEADGEPIVEVELADLVVGTLAHGAATSHHRLIERAVERHGRATCAAVVNGGWRRPGSEGSYGVHLYFGYGPGAGPEDLPDPADDEERIPYRVEEAHDHVTVTGEEGHQRELDAVLGEDWVGDHPFRLARLTVGHDPKRREVVAVHVDGRRVGWLTPHMSKRFGPAVRAAEASGRRLTAAATLEPSRRKGHEHEIDVVLRVPRGWGRDD